MNNKSQQLTNDNTSPQALQDVLSGLFILAWAALGWFDFLRNTQLQDALKSGEISGPALFPMIVLGLLTLGGAIISVKGLIRFRTPLHLKVNWVVHGYAAALAVSLLLMVSMMKVIGFLVASLLFSFFWLFVLSSKSGSMVTNVLRAAAYSLLISASIYGVFVYLIKVPLP